MEVSGALADIAQFRRLDAAFRAGDMRAMRRELDRLEGFPNVVAHPAIGACLPYAIYHSAISLVRELLEAGVRVDQRGVNDYTPLHIAAAQGDREAVRFLRAPTHQNPRTPSERGAVQ